MSKVYIRDVERAALIRKTAKITGVSIRYVNLVLINERTNETVFSVYMSLLEGVDSLVEQVKQQVPFYDERPRPTIANRSKTPTPSK